MKYAIMAFVCGATIIAGCKQEEDEYYYEQAYLSSSRGIDTVAVNQPAFVTLSCTMPNCCGAEFLVTETQSSLVSRTIRVDGRYKITGPMRAMPEKKEIQYTFTPSQRGHFFLNCTLRNGTYAVDTFFVR
jgi:hypothetical protein